MNELDKILTWSEPKRVTTQHGERMLSTAKPNDRFWAIWRAGKDLIKEAGYLVFKDKRSGQFLVNRYAAIDALVEKIEADTREQSRAADSAIEIPAPSGCSYLPYQRAGIAFAARRSNTLIADEMGLGKTVEAIGLVNLTGARAVLIICPASLRLNWQREMTKWLVIRREITVIETGKSVWPADPQIVIINYDLLGKFRRELRGLIWDVLVTDECHYIKNDKAQRTREVIGKPDKRINGELVPGFSAIPAKRKVLMTGTPITNRPMELFPIISFLDPQSWPKFFPFAKRYCDAKNNGFGWDFTGASNLNELQDKLRGSIMIRRLKADVLTELPPKRRQIIALPPNGCAKFIAAEQQAQAKHEGALRAARIAVELAKASDDEAVYKEAVARLRQAGQAAFEDIAKVRHDTAVAKIPYVIEHLQAASAKVVIMAHHHDVVDGIKAALGNAAVVVDGRVSMTERQAAVDRFQSDPNCLYFIGSIRAAGVGITLTAASHVVFAELDWTPGAMSQAEDRCHRIGQVNSVLVQHIVLDGSIDARIARTLIAKQEIITQALDAKRRPDPEVEHDAAKEQEDFDGIIAEAAEAATRETTRKQIAEDAIAITPQQAGAIHDGLRYLDALNADHAAQRNAVGFNKIDTAIGRSLAAASTLSKKQAALGAKILRKYRRQLGATYQRIFGE